MCAIVRSACATRTAGRGASRLPCCWVPRFFPIEQHPFVVFEKRITARLTPESTLLDAGCGHSAELACRFASLVKTAWGVDCVAFDAGLDHCGVRLVSGDLSALPLENESIDVVVARAVMEHLPEPLSVYQEVRRVLRPGGRFLFLTPNAYHYATLVARAVPNRYHAAIVKRVESRPTHDTFDTFYLSNTARAVRRLAQQSQLRTLSVDFAGQFPGYLTFNTMLFLLGTVYEKTVERVPFLWCLRRWLLVELERPVSPD